MKNEIYLRRKNKIIIDAGIETSASLQYVATIMKNVEVIGYSFSKGLIDILKTKTKEELQEFYIEIVPILKKIVGMHVQYNPMQR